MTIQAKVATVFGGTGFLGRQVVRELAQAGYIVRVVTRMPGRADFLKTNGNVGQIAPLTSDGSAESLTAAIRGAQAVVNCVGILGPVRAFQKIHVDLARSIADISAREGVERVVHISALGVDKGTSRYAASKREGEQAVLSACPYATILRPSVLFGPGDGFFNLFGRLSVVLPALPLIGGGKTRLQPVYVGDVADAVRAAIQLPAQEGTDPRGRIYELGGPEVLTMKDIYQRLFAITQRPRCLIPLPWGLAKVQAALLSLIPGKPLLTPDQVESLKTDSIVAAQSRTLADLGVKATALAMVLPSYLERYRPGGRFADLKKA